MTADDWIVLGTGAAAAAACALPGTFLVLRGMSLIGDAISHAVLPGIVLAFLWSNSVATLPVLVGAGAMGLLTVVLIETLHRTGRVKEDTSIAIVFPALFALGVLLLGLFAHHIDLDADCVLHGEIAFAPLDTFSLGGLELPRPLVVLSLTAIANVVLITLFYKELALSTFDGALAQSLGLSPIVVHYLLMGMVSMTTVASFQSIGAILVVAFLIVPASAAYLLTDRLAVMLPLAAAIGVASSAAGYFLARALDASVAGCMATAMGGAFALAWLLAPREGILGRLARRRRSRARFAEALVLERLGRAPAAPDTLAQSLAWPLERVESVLATLREHGLVTADRTTPRPTRAGEAFVRAIVD